MEHLQLLIYCIKHHREKPLQPSFLFTFLLVAPSAPIALLSAHFGPDTWLLAVIAFFTDQLFRGQLLLSSHAVTNVTVSHMCEPILLLLTGDKILPNIAHSINIIRQ